MIRRQLAHFAAIGASTNLALYAVYLLLTHTILGIRPAMTLTYICGIVIGYLLNRNITFRFRGEQFSAFLRYWGAYALGYIFNLIGLWLLVDKLRVAHELAQGCIMVILAALLFLLQKYFVFPARTSQQPRPFAKSAP